MAMGMDMRALGELCRAEAERIRSGSASRIPVPAVSPTYYAEMQELMASALTLPPPFLAAALDAVLGADPVEGPCLESWDQTYRDLGYVWCRPCKEWHRSSECSIEPDGSPTPMCGDDGCPCYACHDEP